MSPKKTDNYTIAFMFDWKKRTEKQQRKYIIVLLISFIVAFILCVGFFFWYQNENYNRIVDQNMSYIKDSALQEAKQIEAKLDNNVKLISNFSNQYTALSSRSNETTEEKLKEIIDESIFDQIGFVLPDGTDITIEGESNIADRSYFQKGLNGDCGYDFIEKSRVTGRQSIVFYAPVKEDDKIIGVMIGFHEIQRLDDMFSYQLFNFTPNTYLLSKNGVVIANSKDEKTSENILDKLSEKKFSGSTSFDEIKEAIENKDRAVISFSFVDGKETSVGIIAQFENSDWVVLSVLPNDVTANMLSNANSAGIVLMILVIITFLMLTCILIVVLKRQNLKLENEMSATIDNFKLTIEHDQKQSFIIESLGNIYSSVYFVDISSKRYERVTEREQSVLNIPSTGKWEDEYKVYMDKFVADNYKDEMKLFCDISEFEEYYNKNGILSVEYRRKDNGWRRAIMIPAEFDDNNNILSVVFAVLKIESEKKKELDAKIALQDAYKAAQLANNAKTIFLSNMSHDIRTPMNAIIGMTAIAAANLDNENKISDCLAKITASSKHLLGLINEVLDMSKIESGKVDLSEEEFSLSKLIDDLIAINQPFIKEKNHTLFVKTSNLLHENVVGDSTRLQQVFTNLLTNAIKYTPDGGKIEILISEKETNKSTVGCYEVVFKDNGIGISEEFQKTLFEPFSRAKDHRITAIQGTGLGMPIAKNIIRMMNGDITLTSQIDKGSTFTVTFTLKLQKEEEIDYKKFVNLPVLVVDDDIVACESTCVILDSLSMKSEWVTSGREAVKKTVECHNNNDDYYALIIDWKMPDMNGIETTKEIRRQIGNDIPIIVMSAYDWSDIENEAREAGVNAFLSKPLFKSKIVNLFSELAEENAEKGDNSKNRTDDIKEKDFSGKRVLLAEDNELNREIAVELLAMMGLEIDTAENGKICFDKFVKQGAGYYDIILMDIQMPIMNGYDTAVAIRSSNHPDAQKIPIVAMTANAFSTDVRAAFDSGMNGHLSKPIDIDVVIKTLEKYLG